MKNPVTLKQAIKGKSRVHAAFSLIELLVVIAVIGIIAAIAIPNIGNLTSGAAVAKNQRNAQTIASVYSAALAAGHPANADMTTAIAAVTGEAPLVVPPGGANAPTFHVPNLSVIEIGLADDYLLFNNSQLTYNPDAVATN